MAMAYRGEAEAMLGAESVGRLSVIDVLGLIAE